jgi:hypothetical protein
MRCLARQVSAALLAVVLLGPYSGPARAQVELEPPPDGHYQPTDPLSFRVDPGMPPEHLQRLGLELNNIDVTAFVRREGDRAIFAPPQPLGYGTHRLRLVEYAPDGAINELALWTIQVRRSRAFREAGGHANLDIAGTHRLDDRNLGGDVPRNTSQGALSAQGSVADDQWALRGHVGLVHNSQVEMMPHDQRVDLASGLVEGSRGAVVLRAGDHVIPATGLVMRDFARRGISGSARLDTLRTELTAFAMRTEAITGFHHGFGVSDSGHRTDGAMLSVAPLVDRPERLQIQFVHLDASGTAVGSGAAGDVEGSRGNATSVAVDSLLGEQRWRLRAEVARSSARFDEAASLGSESDTAHGLLAVYTHPQRLANGSAFNWNAGAEHTLVGPQFFSLGNPALAADRRLVRVFSGAQWGGLAANAQVAREHDNVDDDPNLPRLRTDYLTLGSQYTPALVPRERGIARLFNQPSLALVVQDMTQRYDRVPAAFGGDDVDQDTRVIHTGLRFVPGTWAWDVSHTFTRFRDHAGTQPDYDNGLTELGFDIMLGDRYSLRPRVQYNTLRDRDNDTTTRTTTAGLGVWAALVPGRLDASLDYSVNRVKAGDDSVDTDTQMVTGMLNWQLRTPRENRPGISLFASGSYQDNDNGTGMGGDIYQIFAGMRIGWPVSY